MTQATEFWNTLNSVSGTFVSAACESIQLFHFMGALKNSATVTAVDDSWVARIRNQGNPVFCLDEVSNDIVNSTSALLRHPATIDFLATLPSPVRILIFKPDARTVSFLESNGFEVIGTAPSLARKLESKLLFPALASQSGLTIPETVEMTITEEFHRSSPVDSMCFPFICQFAKSFSGNRTFLIRTPTDWKRICQHFQNRRCRISQIIEGDTWTANSCITNDGQVIVSDSFLQITRIVPDPDGLLPARIGSRGNRWGQVSSETRRMVTAAMKALGQTLYREGYRGFWGADMIITPEHELVAIEVNPRITASACILTNIEMAADVIPLTAIHVAISMGLPVPGNVSTPEYPPGGQIIYRESGTVSEQLNALATGIYSYQTGIFKPEPIELSTGSIPLDTFLFWRSPDQSPSDTKRLVYYGDNITQVIGDA